MKKIKITQVLAIISILFLFSCENEPVDPTIDLNPENPVLPISFNADFSGQSYTTTQANAVFIDGHILINAYRGAELETFTFDIIGTSIGSYLTNENVITYTLGIGQPLYRSVNPADALSNTGQITITSINAVNKRISGNFDFTGYYNNGTVTISKEFTNGEFINIPYIIN